MVRVLGSILVTLAAGACSGAPSVSHVSAPGVDFSSLRSWSWMPDQAATASRPDYEAVSERIRVAVEREMDARGFRLVASDPDFYLGGQLILDDGASYETVNAYWGSGWNYGSMAPMYLPDADMSASTTREIDYTAGTLVIDVFEAETRELVWRGVAEEHVEPEDDPADRQRKADEAVRMVLERFPPGG